MTEMNGWLPDSHESKCTYRDGADWLIDRVLNGWIDKLIDWGYDGLMNEGIDE